MAAHTFIVEHILYLLLGYPFGLNVVGYTWEVLAYSHTRLSEYYSCLDVEEIILKHSDLIDRIRKPKDIFQYQGKITPATTDSVNKGVVHDGIMEATKNFMHVDNNYMIDI